MLAKLVVGAAGLLAIAAGGYLCWQDFNGPSRSSGCCGSRGAVSTECQAPCPTSCTDIRVSCPNHDGDGTSTEALEIAPRELPVQ